MRVNGYGRFCIEIAAEMLLAVGLQIAAVAVLMLGAGVWAGWESAWFVMLGGAAAIIPNALFAVRLMMHRKRPPESYLVVFFLWEFVKIGLTGLLLYWVVRTQTDIRWLALLIGLIVALTAPLFALAFERSPLARGKS